MGQGTSPPVTPAAPATPGNPGSSALTDKQIQAMVIALGSLGKRPQTASMGQQSMSAQPQTHTMQGGSFVNARK